MQRNNPEKLKFFLYSVIVLIFVSTTAVFVNYRFMSDGSELLETSGEKPTVSLDTVQHVATKGGVKQWSLDAAVVNYYQNKKKAVFKELSVLLFSDKNDETKLTALTGELDTDSNNITASGNVIVVNGAYTLKTEKLHFNNEKRIINSFVPVKITEGDSELRSDKMESNLDTGITVLEGNVKGVFRENVNKKK